MSPSHSASASAAFFASKPMPTSESMAVLPAAPALARFLGCERSSQSGSVRLWQPRKGHTLGCFSARRLGGSAATLGSGSGWRSSLLSRAVRHSRQRVCQQLWTHRRSCTTLGEQRVQALMQSMQQRAPLAVGQRVQRRRHRRQLQRRLGLLALGPVAASLHLPLERRGLRRANGRREHDGVHVLLRQTIPEQRSCVSVLQPTYKQPRRCAHFFSFSRRSCSIVALSVVPGGSRRPGERKQSE